ncbi:MAG TPA: protein kinase [Chthoniobacterales bacterium]|jgi:TolB-like protein/tetratricopeptide (TPR) repeat protein/predicted Ser/Thr protein kinase
MMRIKNPGAATSTSVQLCRKCGARTFGENDSTICSACFLEAGLNSFAHEDFEVPAAEFGDYELLEEIGRGGQGVVFRARQKSLNRIVALKIIGLGTWATATHLKRFRREAEAAASLEHPRIVPIYEIGERDGTCYFTMQFVEGGQLDELVRREPLPLRRAAEIIASLAHTVHYAHERGILHRDIKPGNILLDAEGEPHLTDFGLARLIENESTVTRTLEVLGTPSFMAPEQAAGNGAPPTSATDVYGLGAVFYHLLTGHPPFAGGTTYETIRLVLETEPRNPKLWNAKVNRDLTTICLKCLEKDPLRRYPSALALAEDLERWLGHEPIRARHAGVFYRSGKWIRRNPTRVGLLSLGAALSGAVALLVWNREPPHPPAGIAVLPFENLDGDKTNTVFADGVQDDILAKLARIADLKVISRTSVMSYRGARNSRQIGQALHVSHLLEGSVRRQGHRVRLNIVLIDARTDEQVWAEEYNRDLDDVFSTQTEIAQQVTDELHVQLSPNEKGALAARPTKDSQAYDLYVCGAALLPPPPFTDVQDTDIPRSIQFFEKAIARDPDFLLAYCRLAEAHDYLYLGNHASEHFDKANSALTSALRLAPDSGEARFARAVHLYWAKLDYEGARTELKIAARTLPNDARIAALAGLIDRRQGRWDEALREMKRASELDPQNPATLRILSTTYTQLRAYSQAEDADDRILALQPADIGARLDRASLDVAWRADFRPIKAIEKEILRNNPALAEERATIGFCVGLYQRDPATADQVLTTVDENWVFSIGAAQLRRSFFHGLVARMKGDVVTARNDFLQARAEQEKIVREQPEFGPALSALGLIDAQLGRSTEALQEGRRALELMPLEKNALDGAGVLYCFAMICAWTGQHDLALEEIEKSAKIPAGASYGDLRLDPSWDSLRGDPRFEKIVASLAPGDLKNISQPVP